MRYTIDEQLALLHKVEMDQRARLADASHDTRRTYERRVEIIQTIAADLRELDRRRQQDEDDGR